MTMMALFLLWLCMMLLIILMSEKILLPLQRCESSDSDNGNYDDYANDRDDDNALIVGNRQSASKCKWVRRTI